MGRRQDIVSAAVDVIAFRGERALTHRAVDDAAGLPHGSTSNVFRSREALVIAIVEQLLLDDRAEVEAALPQPDPSATSRTPEDYAAALARFAASASTHGATASRARFILAFAPTTAPLIAEARRGLSVTAEGRLQDAGHPAAGFAARTSLALVDGAIIAALQYGTPVDESKLAETLVSILRVTAAPGR